MHCLKMDAYRIIQPIKISGLSVWTCFCWQKNKADVHSLCGIWLVYSSSTNVCVGILQHGHMWNEDRNS